MSHPDVCIAGAGIMGLSLALELHARGVRVVVFDQGEPLSEASTAAAGMLAVNDPENPRALAALSHLSIALYPGYLERLFKLSGALVPFHTSTTLQGLGPLRRSTDQSHLPVMTENTLALLMPHLRTGGQRFALLSEDSLDPRELAAALLSAVHATSIELRSYTPVRLVRSTDGTIEVHTNDGTVPAGQFVDCTGAWAFTPSIPPKLRLGPRKGQMLAVEMPAAMPMHTVVRTPDIYIVPRTTNPERARLVIGATVEDAGFDKTVHAEDIARLRSMAAALLPHLAEARELETWAGLRPGTVDHLPLLGEVNKNHFVAAGHYRNGILLAPATALIMSQMLAGQQVSVNLAPFSPFREVR